MKGKDLRASELVGARVRNAAGDNLGEIEEIVIPSRDQDDMLVIVSVGGVSRLVISSSRCRMTTCASRWMAIRSTSIGPRSS